MPNYSNIHLISSIKKALIALFLISFFCLNTNAQPGANDPTFNPGDVGFGNGDGANHWVTATAIQSDGKIIIGGKFTSYNGTLINHIARLNADGTLDLTFNPGTGANNDVKAISIQSDGKIIIGGGFTSYNGSSRNYITRLNADGSLDATFNPGPGTNTDVFTINIQSDGKIIIGGAFTNCNGALRNRIARLNADGTLDPTFNPGTGADGWIYETALQSDGKIVIVGGFNSYNGNPRKCIARINADGTLDVTFNPGTGTDWLVYKAAIQSNGKIIICGQFTSYNGIPIKYVARLNVDGSLDSSFNTGTGPNSQVLTIVIQNDGKIIICGSFTSYNGTAINRIARLHNDGTLDITFISGTGANYYIWASAIQIDDKIIIGGEFTAYNGYTRYYITRINNNGAFDATFNPGTGANSLIYTTNKQNDGKIIIGGTFTFYNGTAANHVARLNTDGTLDGTFNMGIGTNDVVLSTALQSDGKIIIGGQFTSYNGSTSNYIARLNTNGTFDVGFNIGTGPSGNVNTIAIQTNGKIIIGGDFHNYNGISRNHIARLNADGTLDISFNPGTGANNSVKTIAIQSDGKIVIGGYFTSYNGVGRNYIARLSSYGSLESNFNPSFPVNGKINTAVLQSDGKIIIGGEFIYYNGVQTSYIARLNTDGAIDNAFNPGSGANNFVWTSDLQSNGKIIIGGFFTSINGISRNYIARLNTDGSLDIGFNPGSGASSKVYSTTIQNDGKIIIGGNFTSYNGTGRNRVARILGDPVGINSYPTISISVYPNPVSDELNIETEGNAEELDFEIFNIYGQVVYKGKLVEKTTVKTTDLTPGVYLLKVESSKGAEIVKIVKE